MSVEVTEIILQKLDKIDTAVQNLTVDMATLTQCRETDKQHLENYVNKANQDLSNTIARQYIPIGSLPAMIDEYFQKKNDIRFKSLTFWEKIMMLIWKLISGLIIAGSTLFIYLKVIAEQTK